MIYFHSSKFNQSVHLSYSGIGYYYSWSVGFIASSGGVTAPYRTLLGVGV